MGERNYLISIWAQRVATKCDTCCKRKLLNFPGTDKENNRQTAWPEVSHKEGVSIYIYGLTLNDNNDASPRVRVNRVGLGRHSLEDGTPQLAMALLRLIGQQ